ncbi:hypothetical protein [Nonomuraea soli]|uniref:Uncharacterized protein n=1 Tax=Nonomuraea soli TaxID=1032476 RepID=A0A7W0CFK3_9ACTN|nr:hypothetical protein [Nonomuraea soli]MBA2890099.1 hypothetical protein [Nonomuraea soli]
MPRKSQTNAAAVIDSTGLADRRITATTTPPARPMAMAAAVSQIVVTRPSRMTGSNRYRPMTGQPTFGLRTSEVTTAASSSTTTAAETQRP